jgi:hypothetical protein
MSIYSYQKVESMQVQATHPVWGNVTLVSKWQNSFGHVLHQVSAPTQAGLALMFTVMSLHSQVSSLEYDVLTKTARARKAAQVAANRRVGAKRMLRTKRRKAARLQKGGAL